MKSMKKAYEMFCEMVNAGVCTTNSVNAASVTNATTASTIIINGEEVFEKMCKEIGVSPVDLSEIIRHELGVSGPELLRDTF